MKTEEKGGRDGSQFDMRDSELQSMGELYVNIHQYYLDTLRRRSWSSLTEWLNRMRVFNSYLQKYVGSDKEDKVEENRENILELKETVDEEMNLERINAQEEQNQGPSEELVQELEEIKSELEELRDAAGFTLPMNQKKDPDTGMGDAL